jgi:hypothetical protein
MKTSNLNFAAPILARSVDELVSARGVWPPSIPEIPSGQPAIVSVHKGLVLLAGRGLGFANDQ